MTGGVSPVNLGGFPLIQNCEMCGREFDALRKSAKFCSDKCRYRKAKRKSTRRKIPNDVRWRVLRRDGFRCRYCGATPDRKELKVDHVRPLAEGGAPLDLGNLVTACNPCNDGKRDSPFSIEELPARG